MDRGSSARRVLTTGPFISTDGRYVGFESNSANLVGGDTNAVGDVFVHEMATGKTRRLSLSSGGGQATGGFSSDPEITPKGLFVVFESGATDLVQADTNLASDVFERGPQS